MSTSPAAQFSHERLPQQEQVAELDTEQQHAFSSLLNVYNAGKINVHLDKFSEDHAEEIVTGFENLLEQNADTLELDTQEHIVFVAALAEGGLRSKNEDIKEAAEKVWEDPAIRQAMIVEKERPSESHETSVRSFSEEWDKYYYQGSGYAERQASNDALVKANGGPLSPEQRARVAMHARGEQIDLVEKAPLITMTQGVGRKAIDAVKQWSEPRAAKVMDRIGNRGEEVVPFGDIGEVAVAINAVERMYGDHALISDRPAFGRADRNLNSLLAKFSDDAHTDVELRGEDARMVMEALAPEAAEADKLEEQGNKPPLEMAIASRLLKNAVEYTEALQKQKPAQQKNRKLRPQHS